MVKRCSGTAPSLFMENHSKDTYRQDDLRNIGDERVELLETIRMMVDQEVERKLATVYDPHPEKPPPRRVLLRRLLRWLHINLTL